MSLKADDVYDKETLFEQLSIENWILPAAYARHIGKIAWIHPPWANQIPDQDSAFTVGRHIKSGAIRITCPENYFISEMLWSPEGELDSKFQIDFSVKCLGGDIDAPSIDCQYHMQHFILDIDLDFFSTQNPFHSVLNNRQYKLLKSVYSFEPPKDKSEPVLQAFSTNRQERLAYLKATFGRVAQNKEGVLSDLPDGDLSKFIVDMASSGGNVDWEWIHEIGCTMDDTELPHHVSSHAEIQDHMLSVESFLKTLNKPVIITIARSSEDDYCPVDQVDMIQELVLAMLKRLYGDLDCQHHYAVS